MYLVYLWDGYIFATDTEENVEWIEENYDVRAVTFTDDVEYALRVCDSVV